MTRDQPGRPADIPAPDPARAATYFKERPFDRLLAALRERYVALARIGGHAIIEAPSAGEIAALRGFLGHRPRFDRQGRLQLSLQEWDARLRSSAFGCSLPDLLTAYFGEPIATREDVEAAKARAWQDFLAAAGEHFIPSAAGTAWWRAVAQGTSTTTALVRREWSRDAPALLAALAQVGAALAALPRSPGAPVRRGSTANPNGPCTRLSVFANRVTGDPHAFDDGTLAGRLLERALAELHPDTDALLTGLDTPALRRDTILRASGLLRNDLSSTVLVWGLRARVFGRFPRRVSLHLPLREVERLRPARLGGAPVYVVENPTVFGEIVDALEGGDSSRRRPIGAARGGLLGVLTRAAGGGRRLPAVICTGGQLTLAGLALLEHMAAAGASLYYSGDFDVGGLGIAASVIQRFPASCQGWRLSPDDYLAACQRGGGGLPLAEDEQRQLARYRPHFPALIDAMQEHGKKAFQEAIVDQLVADVVEGGRGRR